MTNAFRGVHRGEWPGLDIAADIYDKWFLIWLYDDDAKIDNVIKFLTEKYDVKGGVAQLLQKNPHERGLVKERKLFGETPPPWFIVRENGSYFEVTLTEKQHTGLFLDQRDNRKWILENSKNKRVANLFSFTSSFSVMAARGGASSVHSVDIAGSVLKWSQRNFKINNLNEQGKYFFYADDVRAWLNKQQKLVEKKPEYKFDIIVCDPPTFASGDKKFGKFQVEKEWENLAKACAKITNSKAQLIFSNNSQKSSDRDFETPLKSIFKRVKRLPTPPDFDSPSSNLAFTRYYLIDK